MGAGDRRGLPPGGLGPVENARKFTQEELHAATGGFSELRRISPEASGAVYRGVLNGGQEVAVKVFHQGEHSSAPNEAVLRPLERLLRMRRMPKIPR